MATYDPKQIKQSFFGVEITGYASGTFLSITSEDGFEKDRGSDGAIDYVNKNVNDLDVVNTLKQTSETNLALNAIHEADKVSNTGIGAYMMDDLQGDSKIIAPVARIMKRPDMVFSDSMESREWNIGTGPAVFICGGNV
jgi:hypothetical protein